MITIHHPLPLPASSARCLIRVDRHSLAHRRFRVCADDGEDFAFDLAEPLHNGACVWVKEGLAYVIRQTEEACFLLDFSSAREAARLGWLIGNLHFKAAFFEDGICVEADSAVRMMLDKEGIHYASVQRVFEPERGAGHGHGPHGGSANAHHHH
jgi:urease accessory protein